MDWYIAHSSGSWQLCALLSVPVNHINPLAWCFLSFWSGEKAPRSTGSCVGQSHCSTRCCTCSWDGSLITSFWLPPNSLSFLLAFLQPYKENVKNAASYTWTIIFKCQISVQSLLERSQALRSLFSYIFSYQSSSQIRVCGFTADGILPAYLRAEMQK